MTVTELIQRKLGLTFNNAQLLEQAFIHRSFLHERPEQVIGQSSNERLEFLGDAVLNFLTASWLYQHFPQSSEGELTAMRAALVKTTTLAGFARSLDLGSHVRISRGENSDAARNRPALLADVFESVLGAIFLDQGLEAARAFVMPFLQQQLVAIQKGEIEIDYRTRLQEYVQAQHNQTPTYQMLDVSGPDHLREFTMAVLIGPEQWGVGIGPSKQAAAQAAAKVAFEKLSSTG